MAKKKKRLKEDAWMWMSRPSVPGIVRNPFFKYSFTAPPPASSERGTAAEEGRSWGTDVPYGQSNAYEGGFAAWKYYAGAGLIDPKIPAEAYMWSSLLGVSRLGGYGVAIAVGIFLTGTALTIIDPHHKWEGGIDETRIYQAGEGGVAGSHPNLNKEIIFGAGSWGSVV